MKILRLLKEKEFKKIENDDIGTVLEDSELYGVLTSDTQLSSHILRLLDTYSNGIKYTDLMFGPIETTLGLKNYLKLFANFADHASLSESSRTS